MRWLIVITAAALAGGIVRARADDLSPKDTRAAQKIYTSKCAKCHKFYDPADYSQEDWNVWLQKMGRKSKLNPQQYSLLSRYLDTLRPGPKSASK
jgi:hypothetical protein